MITVTINGKKIWAQPETTIYQAAHNAGILIPHLCYHPSMSGIGSCRLCLVEVEGRPNLPAACSTLVEDGMVVRTETERVNRARKVVLNHLAEKSVRRRAVSGDTTPEREKVKTVCPYCGVGCAMNLEVSRGIIVNANPANGPANRGLLCVKGRFGWDFIQNPDRLTTPLIKVGGKFIEAGWDEALNLVAAKFMEIKKKYGPGALAGISSAKCTNEENYLFQKFMRAVVGTNNVDNSARLCHSSTITGLSEALGSGAATNSIAELEEAEVIFIIGSNTTEAHPVIGMRFPKGRRATAKIILADPRKTDMAKRAHLHLQLMPGTDVALLNGMMHVILARNLHDKDFINKRTKNFEELRNTVEKYNPDYSGKITGLPADKIVEAAELYAGSKKSTILYAMGITQHLYGTDNVRSTANLAMLTGNIGRPSTGIYPLRGQNNVQGACDMGALPNYLPGYQRVVNRGVRNKFEEKWQCGLSGEIGYTVVEMTEAALKGQLKAMYIMGENPVLSNPDTYRVEKGLNNLEFLLVQDIFLTETALFADVILPGASFAEKDGTFTNTERRVQPIRKAIEPLGYSLPDWEIISLLGGKCGFPFLYSSARDIMEEVASLTPIYAGISHDVLGDNGIQWPCPYPGHPGTRFLHHGRFAGGLGRFAGIEYKPPPELPADNYPLLLITGRNLYHFHTGTMSRRSVGLQAFRPDPYVEINAATAKKLGIEQGELINIESKRGSIRANAFITDRVAANQVFMPFHYAEGAANILTHVTLDKEAKIPELKISAVKISGLTKEKQKSAGRVAGAYTSVSAIHDLPAAAWLKKVDGYIERHGIERNSLLPILQEVQDSFGYIATGIMAYLAKRLNRPVSEVYGLANFYPQFFLKPHGKYMIRVCTGTACRHRGSKEILAAFGKKLGIGPGETTADKLIGLEQVACVGACGSAPVVMVNEKTFGDMNLSKLDDVIEFILRKEEDIEDLHKLHDSTWLYDRAEEEGHRMPEDWENR